MSAATTLPPSTRRPRPATKTARPATRPTSRTGPRPSAVAPPTSAREARAVRKARTTPFVVVIVTLLVIGLSALLLLNTSLQQNAFRIDALSQSVTSLADEQQQLAAQVQLERDPQTLAARATELGMLPGGKPIVRHLRSGATQMIIPAGAPAVPYTVAPTAAPTAPRAARHHTHAAKKAA